MANPIVSSESHGKVTFTSAVKCMRASRLINNGVQERTAHPTIRRLFCGADAGLVCAGRGDGHYNGSQRALRQGRQGDGVAIANQGGKAPGIFLTKKQLTRRGNLVIMALINNSSVKNNYSSAGFYEKLASGQQHHLCQRT
jgi:hypothetical protein